VLTGMAGRRHHTAARDLLPFGSDFD
jgi:hypothetical protein